MSYEFTKLGAVEALTEMPENANALVEVNGAIKRVPASAASGGESAGGGIFEVNVPVTEYNTSSGHDFGEFDKTFAELVAAHNAGKYVRINANWNYVYSTYGYVIGFGKSDGQDTFFVSMPVSPTMPKQAAVYMLYAGDDGKIAAQIMGAD